MKSVAHIIKCESWNVEKHVVDGRLIVTATCPPGKTKLVLRSFAQVISEQFSVSAHDVHAYQFFSQ